MKNQVLRIANLALYLVSCAMVGTGALLAYRLPPGRLGGRGLEVLGLSRHEWGDIHLWLAYGTIGLALLHLILNRVWLAKIAASRQTWRLVAGLGLGIALIGGFLLLPVKKTTDHPTHLRSGSPHQQQKKSGS